MRLQKRQKVKESRKFTSELRKSRHLKKRGEAYAELAYAREDGWNEGKIEGKIELICKKLIKGKSVEQIADDLEDTVENITIICEVANEFAPDYDIEENCMTLQKNWYIVLLFTWA